MRSALAILLIVLVVGAVATHHKEEHEKYEKHESRDKDTQGWMDSMKAKISNLIPGRLGSDFAETQEKVESIYQETHLMAQKKVEDLKEETLRDHTELQKKIADIYHNAALEAEKRIEKLQRPYFSFSRSKDYDKDYYYSKDKESSSGPSVSDRISSAAGKAGDKLKGAASAAKDTYDESHLFDDTQKKIAQAYRNALDGAKSSIGTVSTSATDSWHDVRNRIAKAYNDAFHRGHGETRTLFGKLRDALGRGMHFGAEVTKKTVSFTWHLLVELVKGVFWLSLGGILAYYGMFLWNRRKYAQQLRTHVTGTVVATQEHVVLGNEEMQRKFYDYWSNSAVTYFNRQPGLKKYYMHRGVDQGNNTWLAYCEWNSVDDIRRALATNEYAELKKRMPVTVISKNWIYQTVSTGQGRGEGAAVGPSAPLQHEGLRERRTTTTTQSFTSGVPHSAGLTPIAT